MDGKKVMPTCLVKRGSQCRLLRHLNGAVIFEALSDHTVLTHCGCAFRRALGSCFTLQLLTRRSPRVVSLQPSIVLAMTIGPVYARGTPAVACMIRPPPLAPLFAFTYPSSSRSLPWNGFAKFIKVPKAHDYAPTATLLRAISVNIGID